MGGKELRFQLTFSHGKNKPNSAKYLPIFLGGPTGLALIPWYQVLGAKVLYQSRLGHSRVTLTAKVQGLPGGPSQAKGDLTTMQVGRQAREIGSPPNETGLFSVFTCYGLFSIHGTNRLEWYEMKLGSVCFHSS